MPTCIYHMQTEIKWPTVCRGHSKMYLRNENIRSTGPISLSKYMSTRVQWTIYHDDVIKWKHFPRYWPFLRGIHRSTVNSPHKGQWRGALMFSLICVWINGWVTNREAGDLRHYRGHYDVTVMYHHCMGNPNVPHRVWYEIWFFIRYMNVQSYRLSENTLLTFNSHTIETPITLFKRGMKWHQSCLSFRVQHRFYEKKLNTNWWNSTSMPWCLQLHPLEHTCQQQVPRLYKKNMTPSLCQNKPTCCYMCHLATGCKACGGCLSNWSIS